VTCTIAQITTGGIEVSFDGDLQGFIRKTDLSRDRSEQRPERLAIGDKVDAKIMNVDRNSRRVTLSVKALEISDEREAMAQYGSSDSGASLGDILGAAISRARETEAAQDTSETEENDSADLAADTEIVEQADVAAIEESEESEESNEVAESDEVSDEQPSDETAPDSEDEKAPKE
jgi:predicted RNA-binding protein with RPS1 domain